MTKSSTVDWKPPGVETSWRSSRNEAKRMPASRLQSRPRQSMLYSSGHASCDVVDPQRCAK
eukprot:12130487-Alexandrium_andersonii.AAC.1